MVEKFKTWLQADKKNMVIAAAVVVGVVFVIVRKIRKSAKFKKLSKTA